MEPNSYYFLEGFSDLIQYISIFKTDNKTKYVGEKFIEYITSETAQKTLSKINMFSVLDLKIYNTPFYREWEKVLAEPLNTFNVFLHKENLKEKINLANRALIGDTEAIKKINTWF
jgi:ABC-type Fe3+ transport system substrate-binding protein